MSEFQNYSVKYVEQLESDAARMRTHIEELKKQLTYTVTALSKADAKLAELNLRKKDDGLETR